MSRRSWTVMAAVLLAATLLAGCGDEDDKATPATTSTTISQIEADKRKAEQAQITPADVPGYAVVTPDPADADDETPGVACFADNALVLRVGETTDTRGASSPTFGKDDVLEISSATTFAENVDEARAAIAVFTAPTFANCFSRAWRQALTEEGFTNVTATTSKLPAVTAGEETVGYRTVGRGRANGRTVTLNLDFTFFRVGRAVAMVLGSGVNSTVPEADRTRLVTAVAGRLAS